MTNGTISEKCETLYNKLNSFVTSVINRDVTPRISNLESDVTSLSDSITNINTYTTHLDNANYTVKYNDYRVIIDVHMSSTTFPVNLSNFGADVIPADCLPSQPVAVPMQNVNAIVSIRDNSQGIWRKSNTGSAIQGASCYCHIEYSRV